MRHLCVLLAVALQVGAQTQSLDVPFVQQKGAGCGSAAVAMVVEYWSRVQPRLASAEAKAERIDQLLPVTSRKGIQGRELQRFLQANGFRAFIIDADVSDLQHHLAKGRPVVVCFGPNGEHGSLHYAVIVGIDPGTNSVWMNDPTRGKLFREDLDRFEKEWKRTHDWALLAVPANG